MSVTVGADQPAADRGRFPVAPRRRAGPGPPALAASAVTVTFRLGHRDRDRAARHGLGFRPGVTVTAAATRNRRRDSHESVPR